MRHGRGQLMAEARQGALSRTQVNLAGVRKPGSIYDFAGRAVHARRSWKRSKRGCATSCAATRRSTGSLGARCSRRLFSRSRREPTRLNLSAKSRREAEISLYRQGEFCRSCASGRISLAGGLGQAFKLTNVAGAYWRGDPKTPQLQRVIRTACGSQKELDRLPFSNSRGRARDHAGSGAS